MKIPSLPKNKFLELAMQQTIESGEYCPHDRFFTVEQLKKQYGVSQVTVIQALENLEAAGVIYRRNRSGIFISPTSKVKQLLVVSPNPRTQSDELNRFSFGLGESKTAAEAGLVSINCSIQDFEANASCLDIIYKKLQAVIFFRCARVMDRHREELAQRGIVSIFYGSSSAGDQFPEFNQFCYDERELVFRTLDRLYEAGHRKIACLSIDNEVFRERSRCYIDWMIEKGLAVDKRRIYSIAENDDAYQYMMEQFDRDAPDWTAVFAASNYNLGTGVAQALLRRGGRIPEDTAVIGIGDIQAAKLLRPRLAAMEIDFLGDGEALAGAIGKGIRLDAPPQRLGRSRLVFAPGGSI